MALLHKPTSKGLFSNIILYVNKPDIQNISYNELVFTTKLWSIVEISPFGLTPIPVVCTINTQTRTKSNLLRYSYSVLFNDKSLIPLRTLRIIRICSKSHSSLWLDWTAPDYSTICRRQKHINIAIGYQKQWWTSPLLKDSTGLKFLGEGEWNVKNISLNIVDNVA